MNKFLTGFSALALSAGLSACGGSKSPSENVAANDMNMMMANADESPADRQGVENVAAMPQDEPATPAPAATTPPSSAPAAKPAPAPAKPAPAPAKPKPAPAPEPEPPAPTCAPEHRAAGHC